MKSIREFPQNVARALTSKGFYQSVRAAKSSGDAIKYFLLFIFVLSTLKAVIIDIALVPGLSVFVTKVKQNVVDLYPADLTVQITGGQVATNVQEPYVVPFSAVEKLLPQATSDVGNQNPPSQNLVVIDTKASASDFTKYKTLALVTKDAVVLAQNNGTYQVYPIAPDTNMTIDRRLVRGLWSRISPLIPWAVPTSAVGLWLLLLLWDLGWQPVYLIFGAFFVKILLPRFSPGNSTTFKEAYRIGLYSLTPALLVDFLTSFLGLPVAIPFLFTIVFVVFTIYMLRPLQSAPNK